MSTASGAHRASVYGVVGGMGPLASAEFVKTVYEFSLRGREQDSPTVILYSDPTFPDRTDAFLRGEDEALLAQLSVAIRQLCEMNASRIVLCCMTIHHLLPRLAPDTRRKIWSLLDVIADGFEADADRQRLLLCSNGTRRLQLFENHPRWRFFKDRLVMPRDEDQERIHRDLIYPIKLNPDVGALFPLLEQMLEKYRVDSFVAGCSEIHLLAKQYAASGGRGHDACLDPLTIIAREMAEGHV